MYEDLSGREPGSLAAGELEALAEAAWWLCKTDESITQRQRAYAAYRDVKDDRGAARTAARLFHEHFYRGEGAVAPDSVPGPFALGAAPQLRQLVAAVGFTGVETGTVTAIYELDSPELATRWLRDVAPPISSLVNDRQRRPSDVQERIWEKVTEAWGPYTTADGRVRLENEALWVTGSK